MNAFLPRLALLILLPLTAYGQSTEHASDNAPLDMRLRILATCVQRDAQGRCLPIQQHDSPEHPAPEQVRALTPPTNPAMAAQTVTTTAF